MFGRKYRLHMEEDKYIFQYEGDILVSPEQMSEYIKAFRLSCSSETIQWSKGQITIMDQQKATTKMGF